MLNQSCTEVKCLLLLWEPFTGSTRKCAFSKMKVTRDSVGSYRICYANINICSVISFIYLFIYSEEIIDIHHLLLIPSLLIFWRPNM